MNRGLMWGQFLANLQTAKLALQFAEGAGHLVDEGERMLLKTMVDTTIGLQQRAWESNIKETAAAPKKKRRR